MVYYGADGWQFDKAQFIYDNAERYGAYGDQQGVLSPGYKQRSLTSAPWTATITAMCWYKFLPRRRTS